MIRWIFQSKPKHIIPFLTYNLVVNSLPHGFVDVKTVYLKIGKTEKLKKGKNAYLLKSKQT